MAAAVLLVLRTSCYIMYIDGQVSFLVRLLVLVLVLVL